MKMIEIALKTGEKFNTSDQEISDMPKGIQIIERTQEPGEKEHATKYFFPWESIKWTKEVIS